MVVTVSDSPEARYFSMYVVIFGLRVYLGHCKVQVCEHHDHLFGFSLLCTLVASISPIGAALICTRQTAISGLRPNSLLRRPITSVL